jgi:hypothetical protein
MVEIEDERKLRVFMEKYDFELPNSRRTPRNLTYQ